MTIRDGSDFPPVPVSRGDADWGALMVFYYTMIQETNAQADELWAGYRHNVSAPIVLDFISWVYDLRAPMMRVIKQTVKDGRDGR